MRTIGIAVAACGIEQTVVDRFMGALNRTNYPAPWKVHLDRTPAVGVYNPARTKNRAIRELMDECDVIVTTDIDIQIPPDLFSATMEMVRNGHSLWARCRNTDDPETTEWAKLPVRGYGAGSWMAMTVDDWRRVGGYDERCFGWGHEDLDLIHQMKRHNVLCKASDRFRLLHLNHPQRGHWKMKRSEENRRITGSPRPCNYLTGTLSESTNQITIGLNVTTVCPNSCPHCTQQCAMRSCPNYHMPVEEIDLLCKCVEASGYRVSDLILSGGEPMLWRNLMAGLKRLRKCNAIEKITVFTSAHDPELFNSEILELVDRIRISQYQHNHRSVEQLTKRSPKIRAVDRLSHIPRPDSPILNTLPGACGCRHISVSEGHVFACGNAKDLLLHGNKAPFQTPGYSTPLGPHFMDILRGFRFGDNEICRCCVANQRVAQVMKKQSEQP